MYIGNRSEGPVSLLLVLVGCGADHQVVWDDAASDDVAADVAIRILTLGAATEGDRALVEGLHASGTSLGMVLSARGGESVEGWTVDSADADICQVVADGGGTGELPISLLFRQQGSTDLFVHDADGAIVDWQSIEIRDPANAEVFAYDALTVGESEALDALDVIPGSAATFAVAWTTSDGDPLAGTGILAVSTSGLDVTVAPSDALQGNAFEAFDLTIGADATNTAVQIAAGDTRVRQLSVVVHDPSEITGVTLESAFTPGETDDEGSTGTIRAVVSAGDTPLFGVPVTWTDEGAEVGTGAWVEIEGDSPGESHEITGCWQDLCETLTAPGHVVATFSPVAPDINPEACGCAAGGAAGGAGVFGMAGLLALVRRRR
jgi:MYXO-CTERM domain-containing protein